MKRSPLLATSIVILVLIVAGLIYFFAAPHVTAPITATSTPAQILNAVTYFCDTGSMKADFASSTLMLSLSDGRSFTLPQVQSGSGIRYEQTISGNDVTFESEGSNAFLLENGKTTYANCVAGGTAPASNGSTTFTDQGNIFSFAYPSSVTVSGGGVGYTTDWMVNATTSGMVLAKVTLPSTFEPKTNFQGATLTVGTSADDAAVAGCLTTASSGGTIQKSTVTINGTTYAKIVTNDAGAGNFYETTSYRTVRNNQCYAIEYTIHTSNIGNYSPDQGITAYDQAKVTGVLEGIVQSFKFL